MARKLIYDWAFPDWDNDLFGTNDADGDEIRGYGGNDHLFGRGGDDLLLGGDGNDVLNGGAGNDEVRGNADADTVIIDRGDNIYNGGDGLDTFSFDSVLIVEFGFGGFGYSIQPSAVGFSIDLESGETRSSTLNSNAFTDLWGTNSWGAFEFYNMTDRNDVFRGDNTSDTISTFGGDDVIEGRGGGDTLIAGGGVDTLSYESSPAGVDASLDRRDQFGGDADGDQTFDFENLRGSSFADVLSGDENNNRIEGGAGVDEITGGGGRDIMNGGSGVDAFVFVSTTNSFGNFNQRDIIEDFQKSQIIGSMTVLGPRGLEVVTLWSTGDLIDLAAIDAIPGAGAPGNQAFTFIGSSAFTAAGQVRVTAAQDAQGNPFNLVQADTTGDGVADFQLSVFAGGATLGAHDFIL